MARTKDLANATVVQLVIADDERLFSVRPFLAAKPVVRPITRKDCANVPRPCPYVSCRWNTYLDLLDDGTLVLNWGRLEPDQVPAWGSCVLDIADDGGISEETLMQVLGLSASEVSEVYEGALRKLRHYDVADILGVFKLA